MDTDRIRTFLEIVRSGSFAAAADRLNVTQTTVSARIRSLEDELGKRLFVRNRNGARTTASGDEFLPYAESFLQVWERARRQVAVPSGKSGYVAVGSELSLWNPLLLDWMLRMKRVEHGVALRGSVGLPEQLVEFVRTGTLDIALTYAPRHESGIMVELLFRETLVLVETADSPRPVELSGGVPENYVHVDWGPQFAQQHAARFPNWAEAGVHAGFGPLGLNIVLASGGCGYFRSGVVRPLLETGQLKRVADAPVFEYPAYAIWAEDNGNTAVAPALEVLRACGTAARSGEGTPVRFGMPGS